MPPGDGPVVADTTPIIALSLVGLLNLFEGLYHRVVIPPAVRGELEAGKDRDAGAVNLAEAPWIETVPLRDSGRADLLSDLDRGEAEVLALALETQARLVVIDERLGRQHARRLGLTLTGTIGVLVRAKKRGLLSEVGPILRKLQEGGIYLARGLIQEALRLAGE